MNVFNIKRWVTLTIVFIICLNGYAPVISDNIRNQQNAEIYAIIEKEQQWKDAYELTVSKLKRQEGFRSMPYYCLAGKLTIGYGHVIVNEEFFCLPMSEETADFFLRRDLDSALDFVSKTTSLEGNQLLAMGMFVFSLGSGNFERSTLKQRILANEPIDEEILRWIHIRTEKGIIKSDWLLQSRKIELELFNS